MKKKNKLAFNYFAKNFDALMIRKSASNKYNFGIEKTNIDNIKRDEVLVKVFYSSLNYKDILVCNGNPGLVRRYPHIPGIDAAGIVVSVKSKKFKIGDKVIIVARPMGVESHGGLAKYVKVPLKWVEKLPRGLSLKESMIFGTAGFTATLAAFLLLKNNPKKNDKTILVSGATGGVGILTVYILKKLGFQVCAATSKLDKELLLKKIGAKEVVHRNEFDSLPDMPLLKIRFAGIIDCIGGNIINTGSRQLSENGTIISIGTVSGAHSNINMMPFILRGIKIIGLNAESSSMSIRKRIWKEITKIAKDKKLKIIYKEYDFYKITDGIKKIQSNSHFGRIVVKVK